jgi:hypothetical protein
MAATAHSRSAGATAITAGVEVGSTRPFPLRLPRKRLLISPVHRGHREPPFRCNEPERRIAEDRVANGFSLVPLQRSIA